MFFKCFKGGQMGFKLDTGRFINRTYEEVFSFTLHPPHMAIENLPQKDFKEFI